MLHCRSSAKPQFWVVARYCVEQHHMRAVVYQHKYSVVPAVALNVATTRLTEMDQLFDTIKQQNVYNLA